MKFILDRPLVFLDIEATGLDRDNDRIVELSILKITPGGNRSVKTRRINPGMPIPEKATAIHGITDEDVKDAPEFKIIANGLMELIKDSDIAGFNSNSFDIPLLYNEFRRSGIQWDYSHARMIDIGNIFKIINPRTLSSAVKLYLSREHEGAHGAEADVLATAEVFEAVMERHQDLPANLSELALYSNYGRPILDLSGKFTSDENGDVLLNFSKFRGEKASDHLDFIEWMYTKADFPPDTRSICEQLLFTSNQM